MLNGDLGSLAELTQRLALEEEESVDNWIDARAEAHAQLTGESMVKSNIGVAVQRSQSLRKPGGIPALERTGSFGLRGSHARNGSANTNAGAGRGVRPMSTLQESSLRNPRLDTNRNSRPPSAASTKSPTSPINSTMDRSSIMGPPPSRTKLPSSNTTTTTGLKRTASTASRLGHSRTQSALPTTATSGIALPRPTDLRRRPTNEDRSDPRGMGLKPAFNTLQQHYSPRKNPGIPKPASSSLINAQPPADTTASMNIDVLLSQAKLLQLSILHRDSLRSARSFETSAKRKLNKKFASVAKKCEIVQEEEKEVRKRGNIAALIEWGTGEFDEALLSENIRTLSTVVTEILSLIEDEGRVSGLLEIFEHWIEWVGGIWASRTDQEFSEAQVEFVEGLGEAWRSECRALVRKLGSLGRVLDGLEKPKDGSSIRVLMDSVSLLTAETLNELKMVLRLEGEIVEKEVRRVDEGVGRLEMELGLH